MKYKTDKTGTILWDAKTMALDKILKVLRKRTSLVSLGIAGSIFTLPSYLDVAILQNKTVNAQPKLEERIGFRTDLRTGERISANGSKLRRYKEWINDTVDWSRRNNEYAVVVNKSERKLRVYYNGTAIDSFLVGLSPKSIGEKSYEGDLYTPEGCYNIYEKKFKSIFYKSLMINYPNPIDRLRFYENKEKGIVPKGKGPGSNIAIHGGGNKKDWTYGCIALENEDIDKLFYWAKFLTPVTIVGYE